jgi:hypothetical protein
MSALKQDLALLLHVDSAFSKSMRFFAYSYKSSKLNGIEPRQFGHG